MSDCNVWLYRMTGAMNDDPYIYVFCKGHDELLGKIHHEDFMYDPLRVPMVESIVKPHFDKERDGKRKQPESQPG